MLYLAEGEKETPLSYEPPGFTAAWEYEVIESDLKLFRDRKRAEEVYLHPSISYKANTELRIGDLLGGESN